MAGCNDLSQKWGGYQMLVNIAEYKPSLDAMFCATEVVTDHTTGGVLRFLDYKHDYAHYENKLHKIVNKA